MSDDTKRIAYVDTGDYEDGKAYRCGALVVTLRGEPKEFRCTTPVRPNALQRITYGSSLEPFMLVEVMGKPLLAAMQESIDLYIVGDPILLNLRAAVQIPMVFARRQGTSGDENRSIVGEGSAKLISSPTGEFDTVVLEAFHEFPNDTKEAFPLLEEAARNLDVLEPFDRLQKALAMVHESKEVENG